MDTHREVTLFGHKLSNEEAKALAERMGWYCEEGEKGRDFLYIEPDTVPSGEFDSKSGDYKGCPVVECFPVAPGVHFVDLDGYYVGAVVQAKASRWHDGDCGSYCTSGLPSKEAIEAFLASIGIEPALQMYAIVDNPNL
jgi:hypothetical protein